MGRSIDVSIDTFARIWANRRPHETSEDQILSRILSGDSSSDLNLELVNRGENLPPSKQWTDLLVWALRELGGRAPLSEIYQKTRSGRRALGHKITKEHDASARECLESHCSESRKFRHKADLFYMPEGKGAGIWALR